MRYKILSENEKLIQKAKQSFNLLEMQEAIHIQEVDFWLIDVNSIKKESLNSYKNRVSYAHCLFVVSETSQIKFCLDNGFENYIKDNFVKEELNYWCKYFLKKKKSKTIKLTNNSFLHSKEAKIVKEEQSFQLTNQELLLLLQLSHENFISTKKLTNILEVNSEISIRTIINRIRKKLGFDIFELKKGLGYRLQNPQEDIKEIKENKHLHPKKKEQLEEQNKFLQNIIDSSSIYIVTFIHKKLYCINEAFRDFLGNDIIKELWQEENGDFFKVLIHNSKEYESFKNDVFIKGKHEIKIYNFKTKKENLFEIETLYFENLDKHLLVFKLLK